MKTHTITLKAFQLSLIQRSLRGIQGDRPLMLSYKIAQILKPVDELHEKLIERAQAFVDNEGSPLKGHEKECENILNEELELDIPVLSIDDLLGCEKLTVPDESVVMLLLDIGVLE